MRMSNEDDYREDLELSVLELRRIDVAPSSIRRYVNTAIRAVDAGEGSDGYVATLWLRKRWSRTTETEVAV